MGAVFCFFFGTASVCALCLYIHKVLISAPVAEQWSVSPHCSTPPTCHDLLAIQLGIARAQIMSACRKHTALPLAHKLAAWMACNSKQQVVKGQRGAPARRTTSGLFFLPLFLWAQWEACWSFYLWGLITIIWDEKGDSRWDARDVFTPLAPAARW